MSETKDPAIKLFGKTIPLPEIAAISGNDSSGAPSSTPSSSACGAFVENNNNHTDKNPPSTTDSLLENRDGEDREVEKGTLGGEICETKQKDGSPTLTSEDCAGPDATSGINENPKTPTIDNEAATLKSSRTEEDQSDTGGSQEKTLKKPDKILPCPRCNSMDTKFCYYNNYNVNQPRHFCKNCQRYWTAGGTMRNVPVGAGRRKNKNSSSHYRHITVCETLQTARSEVPNGIHHPTLKPNGTVLTFGSDIPLCESMASVLNLAEKTMRNCTQNGFHKPDELKIPVSYGGGENGDDKLNGSSVTSLSSMDEAGKTGMQEAMMRNCQGLPAQIPCFPGAPWPYPWNSAQWSPPVPPPAFCHSGYPMPFYPAAAYWGCAVPGTWNVPWHQQPSSPNQQASNTGPNSPTLGKHSRDENLIKSSNPGEEESSKESKSERCLWIPKTLRIDDPGEAAKSSIWATLGIKNERGDMISGGGLFKSFQSKGDERNCVAETSPVLQANPAALSRSLNFQESS